MEFFLCLPYTFRIKNKTAGLDSCTLNSTASGIPHLHPTRLHDPFCMLFCLCGFGWQIESRFFCSRKTSMCPSALHGMCPHHSSCTMSYTFCDQHLRNAWLMKPQSSAFVMQDDLLTFPLLSWACLFPGLIIWFRNEIKIELYTHIFPQKKDSATLHD